MTFIICTDGACINNGKPDALAGVGVFFGKNDSRNISIPLEGKVQTNNRAELTAFIIALEHGIQYMMNQNDKNTQVLIQSDSSYCVNGFQSWIFGWAQNDWMKRSDDQPVLNQDLWKQVWELKKNIVPILGTIQVEWVRGHNAHEGNEAADLLATEGLKQHAGYDQVMEARHKARLEKARMRRQKKKKIQADTKKSATGKKRKHSATVTTATTAAIATTTK